MSKYNVPYTAAAWPQMAEKVKKMDNRLSKETGSIKMITSEVSHLVITSKINKTASWC
jgi:hypothetical protein